MRAIEIREPGGPEVLVAVDRPMPIPGADDVLIKVSAAGVNRPDVMQRKGWYPPPPGAPDIPGLEIAGTVHQVGADVAGWRVGDEVCALVSGGGYAEYCSAPAAQCLPLPAGLTFTQAAALPETTFTVWTNMFERARLAPGETVLIHGGASGIGTTAIQLAVAFGARVFVTAGSEQKCAACLALGAERAFNYHDVDWVAAAKENTAGRGVDVVIDIVGGDYFQRNLEVLGQDGRLALIGHLKGPKSQINSVPMFTKRLTITASTLRPRSVSEKGALAKSIREQVWPLIEAGRVQVPVHATFPLDAASDAHRMMEESSHIGKIVLVN